MFVGTSASAREAAWQEVHRVSEDVRIELGPDAVAIVQHHLRYKIVAGQFKTLDVAGLDPRGELAPDVRILAEKGGAEIPAKIERLAASPGNARLVTEDGKPLGRGSYAVDVRYRLDFVGAGLVAKEGAMWTVSWVTPAGREGHDSARIVFSLPAAPTEPRVAATLEPTTTLATLRRAPSRDELELVRVHVPSGEAVTWAARVDPRAFDAVTAPHLRPPVQGVESARLARFARPLSIVAWCMLLFGAAWLLRTKRQSIARAAARGEGGAQPLLPRLKPWQPALHGVTLTSSLASLLWWSPWVGGGLVLVSLVLASHRVVRCPPRPRGPGVWRQVPDAELLSAKTNRDSGAWLDASTAQGSAALAVLLFAVLGAAWALSGWIPSAALAVPLACSALLPIFVTGMRAQIPPRPKELAMRALRPVRDALGRRADLEHLEVGFVARELHASNDIDEVRLSCVPRDRMPGLRSIELAVLVGPDGTDVLSEVLVRVEDASSAAGRLARLAPGISVVVGRSLDEKVLRLRPVDSSASATARLISELAVALEGRRGSDRGHAAESEALWAGLERRGVIAMGLGSALPS